jgi:hypothetical protein
MPSEKLIDLLLAYLCERSDMTAEIGKLSDADWETLLRLCTTQGMAPLLYHRLSNASPSPALVPEKILEDLGEIYYHNAFKNVQYYQELSDVLMHLQLGGIEVIVLKGAYLAKTIYQSQALRIIGDIDLLVKVADLEQTEKILFEMGYGPTERPSIKAQCAKHHHLDPFVKKGAYPIEIHWTLQNQPFKITVESLWEQTRPFTVASVQVLTLSPENLLLHLCSATRLTSKTLCIR